MTRFGTALILGTAMLLSSAVFSLAGDAYRVVPIQTYCHTPDVFDEAVKRSNAGGDALGYLRGELASGACERGRFFFKPQAVAREYRDGVDGAEMVLTGILPSGKTVYIWINSSDYDEFLEPGENA